MRIEEVRETVNFVFEAPIRREMVVHFPVPSVVDGMMFFIEGRHVYTTNFLYRHHIEAGGSMELELGPIYNIVGRTALMVLYNSQVPVRRGWQGEWVTPPERRVATHVHWQTEGF